MCKQCAEQPVKRNVEVRMFNLRMVAGGLIVMNAVLWVVVLSHIWSH